MFPMTAELIKGNHAYPKRILILNKKTYTFQELGVWERLTELKVCEMHETQNKKKRNPCNVSVACLVYKDSLQCYLATQMRDIQRP